MPPAAGFGVATVAAVATLGMETPERTERAGARLFHPHTAHTHPSVDGAVRPVFYALLLRGPTVWIANTVSVHCAADIDACSRFLREA